MTYVLYFFHIIVSVFLILVVLLQQGKGADLSVFGGGSTQAAFGARGAATLLHKLTVGAFVVFTLTTLSISLFTSDGSSVTTKLPDVPAATTAPAETDAGISPPADATTTIPVDAAPATPPPAENPGGGT